MTTTPNLASINPVEPGQQSELIRQATRSVKWTMLGNAVPRLITPVSTIILAALLTPADFGLVAIATFVIALAQIVVELGLGAAVVQRRKQVDEAASSALWLSLLIAIALYGILWVLAPGIAAAYQSERAVAVIRVAALSLPIGALISTPRAILQRNLEFRRLFWVTSALLVTQSIVSVVLAVMGLGAWALIGGQLTGKAVSALLVWALANWRPAPILNWPILRSLLGFSLWVMISSFQTWLFLYADNAIAGFFLGENGLGVYALGFNIASLAPGFLMSSLASVVYPTFCALDREPQAIGRNLMKLQRLAGGTLLPLVFGISAIAVPLIGLLYDNKWEGLGFVIQFLVINGLGQIWSLNADTYRAIGRPDIWPKLAGTSLLILIPLLLLAGPHGLMVFTLARFVGGLMLPLMNIVIGARILDISLKDQWRALVTPFSCAVAMYLVAQVLKISLAPFEGIIGWLKLLLVVVMSGIFYIGLIWRMDRDLLTKLMSAARQAFAR